MDELTRRNLLGYHPPMADQPVGARGNETHPAEPENDLDRIERKLDALLAMSQTNRDLSTKIATVVEVERRLVDGFDDRLARNEALTKSLGTTAAKLAFAKLSTSAFAGAASGLVTAAVVAYVLFASIAHAH